MQPLAKQYSKLEARGTVLLQCKVATLAWEGLRREAANAVLALPQPPQVCDPVAPHAGCNYEGGPRWEYPN